MQAIALFGRLADHRAVCGCTYEMDTDVPHSLWINNRWSRRLKNNHPQWLPLFASGTAATRTEFAARLRSLPFKYPLAANNLRVPLCATARAALGPAATEGADEPRWSPSLRATVQQHFAQVALSDAIVDRAWALLGGGRGKDGVLERMAFETRVLEMANLNFDLESDPVLEYDVFAAELRRRA
eukprot:g7738.t1